MGRNPPVLLAAAADWRDANRFADLVYIHYSRFLDVYKRQAYTTYLLISLGRLYKKYNVAFSALVST